jgi:hypothetical protein
MESRYATIQPFSCDLLFKETSVSILLWQLTVSIVRSEVLTVVKMVSCTLVSIVVDTSVSVFS